MSASVSERLSAWVFGGQNIILKIAYDLAYVLAGGVVDSPAYDDALDALNSTVIEVETPGGDISLAIFTPRQTLFRETIGYTTFIDNPAPCSQSPTQFSR